MPLDETAGEEEAGGVIASKGQAMSASYKGRIDSDIWAFVKQSAEQLRMLPGMQGLAEAQKTLRNAKRLSYAVPTPASVTHLSLALASVPKR